MSPPEPVTGTEAGPIAGTTRGGTLHSLPLTSPPGNDVLPAMSTLSNPTRLWWRTF